MRVRYSLQLAVLCLLAVVALAGQNFSEDEIRVGSRPYVPTTPNTVRVKSNLVEIPVVVRDGHGNTIGGLAKDSFEVDDRGKKQAISFFAVESASGGSATHAEASSTPGATGSSTSTRAPRYVAFYFDDFSMPQGDLVYTVNAAKQFVRENVEPEDKVGVFTTSTSVSQDFTNDKDRLLDALGKIRTHQRSASGGAAACPNLIPIQAYMIVQTYLSVSDDLDLGIAQAISCHACPDRPHCLPYVVAKARETLAVSEQISDDTLGIINGVIQRLSAMPPGARILVMASSGFMAQTSGPKQFQEKVIEAALRAKIVINSLDAKGLWTASPGGDVTQPTNLARGVPGGMTPFLEAYQDRLGMTQKAADDDPLAAIAEGTGGRFFHNSNDMAGGFRELAMAPEFSYVLGFAPENTKADGTFHDLKVKLVSSRGLNVEARRGYFAPAPPTKAETQTDEKLEGLDRQVLTTDTLTDVNAEVATKTAKSENSETELQVAIHVDIRGLPFQNRKDRHVERLLIVTALFDAQDRFLDGVQQVVDLSLKDATLAQLTRSGLTANVSMPREPGTYRLREVVLEAGSGHMAALNRTVEIH